MTCQQPLSDAQIARDLLEKEGHTCVLCQVGAVRTTTLRGVRPLMQWLKSGQVAPGFCAADKVVGKATAFLYCLLGARSVYAGVMSRSAHQVLRAHGIDAQYGTLAEYIVNRQGDGICPFEAAVMDAQTPEAALSAIEEKMKQMNIPL